MQKIFEAWKNRKQIMEGLKNSLIRKSYIEAIASDRYKICKECDKKDDTGKECAVPGTQPCCSLCGCTLSLKTRSLSSECPAGKWKALITEEDEDELENYK
jgi:RNA polymerase-binding transcription factor DksA